MYGYENWTIKKAEHQVINAFEVWCWRRLFESSLDCKENKSVHPKGNQSWIFIGRADDEAEIPILWPPDVKNWLIEKDPHAGKDWRQKEKGMTEEEMIGWHHWFYGHEFEQAPGIYDGKFISHARILEWVTFPFARGSSQPRDQTQVSRIAGKCFTSWATRKALGYCS